MSKQRFLGVLNAAGLAIGVCAAVALVASGFVPLPSTDAAAPQPGGQSQDAVNAATADRSESEPQPDQTDVAVADTAAEGPADACCQTEPPSAVVDNPAPGTGKLTEATPASKPEGQSADAAQADAAADATADACCQTEPPSAAVDTPAPGAGALTEAAPVSAADDAPMETHAQSASTPAVGRPTGFCGEHQLMEAECGICQPQLAGTLAPGESLKLRMPSAASADLAGVVAMPARSASTASSSEAILCRVNFDPTRIAHLTPLLEGVIRETHVDLGASVEEGQALVKVAAPALADAKNTYLGAIADVALAADTHEREESLREKGIATEAEYQAALTTFRKAETAEYTARQRLLDVGITDDQLAEIRNKRDTGTTVAVRAPFTGTVIEWHAIQGEAVGRSDSILTIADLSVMALDLAVPRKQIANVRVGSKIAVRFEELPGITVDAKVDWVAPTLDEDNRTVKARAIVQNPNGLLKAGMFGRATLQGGSQRAGMHLPKEAVQTYDDLPFVFVKMGDDLYDVRRVTIGEEAEGQIEIVEGITPDESVVVAQSFAVKSEFLKSRLGAGCTHD